MVAKDELWSSSLIEIEFPSNIIPFPCSPTSSGMESPCLLASCRKVLLAELIEYNCLASSFMCIVLLILRFHVSCSLAESEYLTAEEVFGSHTAASGEDTETCPAVQDRSDEDCEDTQQDNCWSVGQRDTDCRQGGLCW